MNQTSHQEQVEQWANYIRDNPTSWRIQHTRFLNAQIQLANDALQRIRKQKNGKEKLVELFSVKNKQIIASL